MRDRPLPPDMQAKWGHLPHLRSVTDTEWHAACPVCGDSGHRSGTGPPDRFHIHMADARYNARGVCRRCGELQWLDDDQRPDPARIQQAEEVRRRHAEQEQQRLEMLIGWLNDQAFWRGYHLGMSPKQRELWHAEGIPDWAIDAHKLGFNAEYHYGPALSIPYFGKDWITAETLQYRLINETEDRYRFMKGLGPRWFRPWPEVDDKGVALIFEGAKKALVAYDQTRGHIRYRGAEVTCLATPMDLVPNDMIPELENFETVIWCLDPDTLKPRGQTRPAIERNINLVGHERSRVVHLPDKVDDLFVKYGLRPDTFQAMVNQAMPWDGRLA